jgi:hypothetical protein
LSPTPTPALRIGVEKNRTNLLSDPSGSGSSK